MLFEIVTVSELRKTIKNLLRDSYSTEKERETNTEIERHDILYLLAILAEAGSLDYPLTLVKRERPDFQLVMANRRIGIEHTRAVSENEAHKDSLRRKGYGPETFFISPVALGESRKNKKQL